MSLIIILYVAFAFAGVSYPVGSWIYGGITILALLHDVIVPTAVMALMGYLMGVEADVLFIMAILAVLGYSVNDTIVVFDRVRENLIKYRQEKKVKVVSTDGMEREETTYILQKPFGEIVGMSVSQTLMRSINTSVTTLVALTALYFIGGEVTQTFSLVLIVGVLAGTYSSICIANPLLVFVAEKRMLGASKDLD
ncbi:MAG: preprotein translocase subunit SecF [Acidimicrobiales bacterium]